MNIYDELGIGNEDRHLWFVVYWRHKVRYVDYGHKAPEGAYRTAASMSEYDDAAVEGVLWPDGRVDAYPLGGWGGEYLSRLDRLRPVADR